MHQSCIPHLRNQAWTRLTSNGYHDAMKQYFHRCWTFQMQYCVRKTILYKHSTQHLCSQPCTQQHLWEQKQFWKQGYSFTQQQWFTKVCTLQHLCTRQDLCSQLCAQEQGCMQQEPCAREQLCKQQQWCTQLCTQPCTQQYLCAPLCIEEQLHAQQQLYTQQQLCTQLCVHMYIIVCAHHVVDTKRAYNMDTRSHVRGVQSERANFALVTWCDIHETCTKHKLIVSYETCAQHNRKIWTKSNMQRVCSWHHEIHMKRLNNLSISSHSSIPTTHPVQSVNIPSSTGHHLSSDQSETRINPQAEFSHSA